MHSSGWLPAAALTAALAVAVPFGASATPPRSAACKVASNVVFLVDDSRSMLETDPGAQRVQALELEIKRSSNAGKTFAAIEFGDTANALFPPELVKTSSPTMLGSLGRIQADNGATDYNLAFDTANSTDPTAQARVFITDGGHDVGDYDNTHLNGGKPPTYVVGFGTSGATPGDAARLKQIATDTGGQYFPLTSSVKLVPAMNQIDALLDCQPATSIVTINDVFTKAGPGKTHAVTVPKGDTAEDLVTSFDTGSGASISSIVETLHGKAIAKSNTVATSARKRKKTKLKKLKVTIQSGATFINLHIAGLKPGGKLQFKVKAGKNPAGAVTTQLTPKRS